MNKGFQTKMNFSEITYKEVSDKMNVSPKTIDGYRESLFSKIDLKSRVGLVLFAVRNNLVQV
jgi:DNA-binding CsgD family transcriptional regulator